VRLLVQEYKSTKTDAEAPPPLVAVVCIKDAAQHQPIFTACVTSTKVPILTLKTLVAVVCIKDAANIKVLDPAEAGQVPTLLALLVQKYKY
jgi:hypothetical protein